MRRRSLTPEVPTPEDPATKTSPPEGFPGALFRRARTPVEPAMVSPGGP
ncbi:hypothetical protein RC1_2154 [Rhodospirillum centenum SW]|uniref:Uncharacterized protein n=1 Tax=Rhodospirillum centenum (strain ATCC 51521 / SW) TaxID=414684 RepID=B6IU04_RHOCS|nr:hypothetical protein RC1_2154 [Rhodospirillum centenum SW]